MTTLRSGVTRVGTPVTPSDSTVVAFDALFVGSGGDVVIKDEAGTTLTFSNVPDGSFFPQACTRVMAATGASNIIGLNL